MEGRGGKRRYGTAVFYRISVDFYRIATGSYRINLSFYRVLPAITAYYRITFFFAPSGAWNQYGGVEGFTTGAQRDSARRVRSGSGMLEYRSVGACEVGRGGGVELSRAG